MIEIHPVCLNPWVHNDTKKKYSLVILGETMVTYSLLWKVVDKGGKIKHFSCFSYTNAMSEKPNNSIFYL